MKPMRDRILVKMDESLSPIIHVAPTTEKWREARDQISNRGEVIAVGEGSRHPKTAVVMLNAPQVGQFVRFSELQYPSFVRNGHRYALITNGDIVGIEQ